MSADLLREAAAKMRERATYAKPGPWAYLSSGGTKSGGEEVTYTSADLESSLTVECGPDGGATFDCVHFTSWHPAVALAVADWLDEEFAQVDLFGAEHPEPRCECSAHTVARAYLGRDA